MFRVCRALNAPSAQETMKVFNTIVDTCFANCANNFKRQVTDEEGNVVTRIFRDAVGDPRQARPAPNSTLGLPAARPGAGSNGAAAAP